ncbi:helix-turn-helix domain-containing protein [Streptomyces sp. NPDC002566]|uniref:helix-turn-helix domain-containing protein n=1 Tax=Streptomyces sp. NPDC002566 TaxID=3364650 RepID=UPI00367A2C0E
MHDDQMEPDAALTELRRRLTDGLARARLTKTQLSARAGRGRTTVQQALRADGPVPSAETVAALAHVLNVPVEPLLELRRIAAGESGTDCGKDQGPGRPIGEWDPHDLELHPAGPTAGGPSAGLTAVLPGYVARAHDQTLARAVLDAAQGRSRMVVLVGSSSTGKTRACWEAVQSLAAPGWRLWHPFDPTRADAALDGLERVRPRTVVWLNEAQHYLGDPRVGEQIAAAVHTLLTQPGRGPVLVLGTLWPEYADLYTALPSPRSPDPHSRVRELLAGRTVTVPETFDQEALHTAATLAVSGDRLLHAALTRARGHGRVTQDLAGAPELRRRYDQGTPAVRAVLEAAMDARRLGVGLHLPLAFLIDAAIDYLSDQDYDDLTEDWAEAALADLARPVHGRQAPLRRMRTRPQHRLPGSPQPEPAEGRATSGMIFPVPPTPPGPPSGPVFRLADYLEQHGRNIRGDLCPPPSFWDASLTHLTHDDLYNIAVAARVHKPAWADPLLRRAALAGHAGALSELTMQRLGPEGLGVISGEGARHTSGAATFLGRRGDGPRALPVEALVTLAMLHEDAGDIDSAEALRKKTEDPAAVRAMDQHLLGALVVQLQAMRHRTAQSVLNNIR